MLKVLESLEIGLQAIRFSLQTEQNPAEREADAETEQGGNANVEERQSVQNGGARAWDQVDGNGDGDQKNQINGERGKTVLHIRPTQGNV